MVFFASAQLHQKGISKAVLRPVPEASFTHLGSHVPFPGFSVSLFFFFPLNSGHAFVYVWVCSFPKHCFTCSGDQKEILGGAKQEKQHNGLHREHSDKLNDKLNVTSRSVTAMCLTQRPSPFQPVLSQGSLAGQGMSCHRAK